MALPLPGPPCPAAALNLPGLRCARTLSCRWGPWRASARVGRTHPRFALREELLRNLKTFSCSFIEVVTDLSYVYVNKITLQKISFPQRGLGAACCPHPVGSPRPAFAPCARPSAGAAGGSWRPGLTRGAQAVWRGHPAGERAPGFPGTSLSASWLSGLPLSPGWSGATLQAPVPRSGCARPVCARVRGPRGSGPEGAWSGWARCGPRPFLTRPRCVRDTHVCAMLLPECIGPLRVSVCACGIPAAWEAHLWVRTGLQGLRWPIYRTGL